MALRAHARVRQDLRDSIFSRRRLLKFIGSPQGFNVIHRVVVRDVLQGIGNAVDNVLLGNDAHGEVLTLTVTRAF